MQRVHLLRLSRGTLSVSVKRTDARQHFLSRICRLYLRGRNQPVRSPLTSHGSTTEGLTKTAIYTSQVTDILADINEQNFERLEIIDTTILENFGFF